MKGGKGKGDEGEREGEEGHWYSHGESTHTRSEKRPIGLVWKGISEGHDNCFGTT